MKHFDYVLQPNGCKKKIFGMADIESTLAQWQSYIEDNWISPQNKMFDPESKVKYMLEGLANILLRNHMDGILTEYKKMKIGKYEFPFSSCGSLFTDEIYSEFTKYDNGEDEYQLNELMAEMAQRYDEAKAAKTKKQSKPRKVFPPTRRQKIETTRKKFDISKFEFARVDTEGRFIFQGHQYEISPDITLYNGKLTKDGDELYDMDQILCGQTRDNRYLFFDMNIEPVEKIILVK